MSTMQTSGAEPTVAAAPAPRPLRWWDAAVAAVLLLQTVLSAFEVLDGAPNWADARPEAIRFVLVLAPLALVAIVYAAFGRAAILRGMRDQPLGRSGALFLALLVAVLAAAVFTTPMHAILQTLVYPMIWSTASRYRDAVLWSALAAGMIGASLFTGLHLGGSPAALASAAITAPISFVFSVAMGTWITRIFAQGERYREVAERLRASQAEVAELSEQAGAAAERERLSRELHDTLTQTLAGLVMLAEQADRALAAGDTGRARERLARVDSAAREAVREARALVATTQPLGDGGLEAAIERVASRLRADTGLDVRCELEAVVIDRERQVVLLRAAQEGLANARKHARASTVRLRLAPSGASGGADRAGGSGGETSDGGLDGPGGAGPGRAGSDGRLGEATAGSADAADERARGGAVLRVEDDGVGPQEGAQPGFGLSGLRDRARNVGGEVVFERSPLGGALLEVSVGPSHGSEEERS